MRRLQVLALFLACDSNVVATSPVAALGERPSSQEVFDWMKVHYLPELAADLGSTPRITLIAADGQRLLVESFDGGPLVGVVLLNVEPDTANAVRVLVAGVNGEGARTSGPIFFLEKSRRGVSMVKRVSPSHVPQ